MKKIKNSILLSAIVALFSISNLSFANDASLEPLEGMGGCSFKVLDMEFPCTRIWCPSTMSMSSCGLGDAASQTCSQSKSC
jgi:hypothetical protein